MKNILRMSERGLKHYRASLEGQLSKKRARLERLRQGTNDYKKVRREIDTLKARVLSVNDELARRNNEH